MTAEEKPQVIIYCGPPASGKSSHRRGNYNSYMCICRDNIRFQLFGRNYKQNYKDEMQVNDEVKYLIQLAKEYKLNTVVDQTNCKRAYITDIVDKFKATHQIVIHVLYEPLWKLYYRNALRYILEGKFIPFKVISRMFNNQKRLDWTGLLTFVKTIK